MEVRKKNERMVGEIQRKSSDVIIDIRKQPREAAW